MPAGYNLTVYGTAQNLSASYTAGVNVTYADVMIFDQQSGNVSSAETVLFDYGSYPRACGDVPQHLCRTGVPHALQASLQMM